MAGGGSKPGERRGGRAPGTPNKLPRDLKEKVLAICDHLETQNKGLQDEAEKDPQWFYANFVKPMLPKDVKVGSDPDNPLITEIVVKHVKPDTGAA